MIITIPLIKAIIESKPSSINLEEWLASELIRIDRLQSDIVLNNNKKVEEYKNHEAKINLLNKECDALIKSCKHEITNREGCGPDTYHYCSICGSRVKGSASISQMGKVINI